MYRIVTREGLRVFGPWAGAGARNRAERLAEALNRNRAIRAAQKGRAA
ncbi:MAG TPA: hypothetical protein VNQ79_06775 [Blastocatellia bacterium]|nr:hypothetical protein [Blastocatellia bacterium]